jgi:hypothetical protein
MTKTPKRPRDVNQRAKYVVDLAVTELPANIEISPFRKGQAGGKVGGAARANSLTPEERSKLAKRAARSRWSANKS